MAMTAAVVVGAAVAVGTAYANWRSSKDAQKAKESERRKMEAMFNRIQNPELDPLTGGFAPFSLSFEEYKLLQKYIPEAAEFVEEKAPQVIEGKSEAAKEGLSAQRAALKRLQELSRSGEDIYSRTMREEALSRQRTENRAQQDALRTEFQRRGQMTPAMEMVMRQQAGQESRNRAAEESRRSAAEAYRRQLESLQGAARLGGQIRQSELDVEAKNAAIMNAFNQRTADRYQQWLNQKAQTLNEASLFNIQAEQDIHNKNIGLQNIHAQEKYKHDLASYQDKVMKQKYANELKQKAFENEIAKARGAAGLSAAAREDIDAKAKADQEMYQGLGEGLSSAAYYYGDSQQKTKKQDQSSGGYGLTGESTWTKEDTKKKKSDVL